jgi:hypothetical protein
MFANLIVDALNSHNKAVEACADIVDEQSGWDAILLQKLQNKSVF